MGTRLLLSLALTGLLLGGPADAGVIIEVDEHGDGVGTLGGGSLAPDPGPGGLPAVLTYRLPFAGTVGDVYLTEPVQVFSDVIRFNGTRTLVFYSSSSDGFDSRADTLGPPAIPYANFALIPEVATGNDHAATYTPVPGQPGYDPVAQPTYIFVSDGFVAAPPSVVMGGTAALVGLGCWCRHRHRTRAAARGMAVARDRMRAVSSAGPGPGPSRPPAAALVLAGCKSRLPSWKREGNDDPVAATVPAGLGARPRRTRPGLPR